MTFYLSGAGAYCAFLLFCKFSDKECSKTDLASWLVVLIASALWIVVIPISFLEIRSKAKLKSQMQDQTELSQSEVMEAVAEFDANTIGELNPSNS